MAEPSVHHNTRGSYVADNRSESSCSNTVPSCSDEPIGICQAWRVFVQERDGGRVEHDSRRHADRSELLAQA